MGSWQIDYACTYQSMHVHQCITDNYVLDVRRCIAQNRVYNTSNALSVTRCQCIESQQLHVGSEKYEANLLR